MNIYCCGCEREVIARLTDGVECYPHRGDLMKLPFWKCDECGNFVGCHHKTKNRTRPLGVIPTKEIKNARRHIHIKLDKMWSNGRDRKKIYKYISNMLGYEYHTADIKSVQEARRVYRILNSMNNSIGI